MDTRPRVAPRRMGARAHLQRMVDAVKKDLRGAALLIAFATLALLAAMAFARGAHACDEGGYGCTGIVERGKKWSTVTPTDVYGPVMPTCRFKTASKVGRKILRTCVRIAVVTPLRPCLLPARAAGLDPESSARRAARGGARGVAMVDPARGTAMDASTACAAGVPATTCPPGQEFYASRCRPDCRFGPRLRRRVA
jgi:hypothetical protein